jgi:hypothetical protein
MEIIKNEYEYHSLSPTDDADEDSHYSNALSWALQNSDKIKNIAMAGPFGSGKSSILQTFQKKTKNQKLKFLNISLATFHDGDNIGDKKKKTPDEANERNVNLFNLIELSILQQIIFHEKDSKLPDSRLVKIKNYPMHKLILHTSWFMFISALLVYDQFPDAFYKILGFYFSNEILNLSLHITFLVFWAITIFFIFCKILRILKVFRLIKFAFKNAEIEINDNINKSILNNHLDEILYFFEVTKYNVVIFEDLDRFQQTDVFTKLREINLLINNSEKIGRNVVFIYAIKDDMFHDNERTKFFDFIIPVIPVINTSNSSEILLKKRDMYFKDEISNELIENVSYFFDDMRLLFNIINEYSIYRKKLGESINKDKLFAIIVYKNLFPNDFVKLCNNEGKLFNIISQKKHFVSDRIKEIDEEIGSIKEFIHQVENVKLRNIKELRTLYIFQYISSIKNRITAFAINNTRYEFGAVLSDELFDYIIKNQFQYYYSNIYRTNYSNFALQEIITNDNIPTFQDIEKRVDAEYTYEQRKKQIETNISTILNGVKEKIRLKEKEKIDVRHIELSTLFNSKHIDNAYLQGTKQDNIIFMMIQNGYIDENYYDYVSLFHESSITRADYIFSLNVKNRILSEFDYELTKIGNLIRKISHFDFGKPYILNFNLVDFILDNLDVYESERKELFTMLSNESDVSVKFIDGFIDNGENIESFVKELCKYWNNFWNYIDINSDYTNERKLLYYQYIIKFAEIENIQNIAKNSSLKAIIESDVEFCNIVSDIDRTKKIIQTLEVKFSDLDYIVFDEIIECVYQGNYYKINSKTIERIFKFKERIDSVGFDFINYAAIKNSTYDNLIKYIDSNISEYVDMVYLENVNTDESEDSLILLLNNENINIERKEKMIKTFKGRISSFDKVENVKIKRIILNESKIKANWTDLVNFYHIEENNLTEEILEYLSVKENIQEITREKIKKDIPDTKTMQDFCQDLLLCETIDNNNYSLILNSIPYYYPSLEFENLTEEKVVLLLNKGKLEVNSDNFVKLKNNFPNRHIILLEKQFTQFIEKFEEMPLEEGDSLLLLKSNNISIENKNLICDKIDEDIIITNSDILDVVGELIYNNANFKISRKTLQMVLLDSRLNKHQKINIFDRNMFGWPERDFISNFLLKLGYPYDKIMNRGKRPKIPFSKENLEFVEKLKENNYISQYVQNDTYIRVYTYRS